MKSQALWFYVYVRLSLATAQDAMYVFQSSLKTRLYNYSVPEKAEDAKVMQSKIGFPTNIDRRKCSRTLPMRVLVLGLSRTGTEC